MIGDQIRVLFLDIDGVITYETIRSGPAPDPTDEERQVIQLVRPHLEGPQTDGAICADLRAVQPTLLHRLNGILCEGVSVVITSTWRMAYTARGLQILLESRGFVGRVIGCTPVLHAERGEEIQAWLDQHQADLALMGYTCPPFPGSVYSCVILDDNADMGRWLPRLVQTDSTHGLSDEDVKRAKTLLQEPIG